MLTDKEKNKLIERKCKHDAYRMVFTWARQGKEDFVPEYGSAAWYAKTKMEGHAKFLAEHLYEYDYATSTFKLKKEM